MRILLANILSILKNRWKLLTACGLAGMVFIVMVISAAYLGIEPYHRYILGSSSTQHSEVGLVLGAGITKDGKPYKELQARLDSAASALDAGTVKKLILSGDNRFKNYDEPTAMYDYLIKQKRVPADKLQRDFAGRSTYESCERASKVFGVKKVILFSSGSHLPRAIYICRHFGIETYGITNDVEANNSTRREMLARVKAIYNVHIYGERTVLGSPIKVD